MTISFQTQGGHTYGTLCTVTRVGQKVVKTYGESLGRVVDKERLVFYSRSRGLFQYDPTTGSYLPAPPDVEMPKRKSRLKVPAPLVSFVFGDVYLLDRFMDKLGLYPVLESAYKDRSVSIFVSRVVFKGAANHGCPSCIRGLKITDQRLRGTLSRRQKCAKRHAEGSIIPCIIPSRW